MGEVNIDGYPTPPPTLIFGTCIVCVCFSLVILNIGFVFCVSMLFSVVVAKIYLFVVSP